MKKIIASNINTIIWDWNGTLLNDLDICIDSINILLKNRSLPPLSKDKYLEIFSFPVKNYYEKAGFDFKTEPFEIPAHQFMDLYDKMLHSARVFPEVIDILSFFKKKNFRQFILSAMEHNSLTEILTKQKILKFFEGVYGIDDIYANGKLETGKIMFSKHNIKPEQSIFIGDTLHDLEVAEKLGVAHLLVARGHQSKSRLLEKTRNVVDNLSDIKNLFS